MIVLKVKLTISLNCVHYPINCVHYPILQTFFLSSFKSCHWNAIVQIGTTWGKVRDGNRPWIWNWHLMAEESNTLIWPQNAVFFFAQHKCSTVPWLDFGLNKISHPSLPKLGTPIQEYGVTLRFDLQLYLSLFCSTTLLALSLVINVGHKVLSFPHKRFPRC